MHPLLSSRPMLLNVRIFASLTRMYRMIFLIEIGLLISVMTESNFYSSTLHLSQLAFGERLRSREPPLQQTCLAIGVELHSNWQADGFFLLNLNLASNSDPLWASFKRWQIFRIVSSQAHVMDWSWQRVRRQRGHFKSLDRHLPGTCGLTIHCEICKS